MISKRFTILLLLLWGAMFLVWACTNVQSSPMPFPTDILPPQSTMIPSPTALAPTRATLTPTPAPNYCPRETIPPNVLEASNETDNSKLIAFMASTNGYGFDDIFVMNVDGSNKVNITNSSTIDRFPVWSPNGKKIAFLSNRNYPTEKNECNDMVNNDCVFEIFVSNRNGADLSQISQGWNFAHRWSPDSKKVAYSFFFPDPNTTPAPNGNRLYLANIYVVNADGSNEINLTRKFQPGAFSDPIWSPDSQKLAFVYQNGIVIINADGTGATEYNLPDVRSVLYWSNDDRFILFMNDNYQVVKSNLDFSNLQILPIPFISSGVKFSPNGKWFAYEHSYYNSEKGIFCHQIRIANVDTFENYFVYDENDIDTAAGDYLKPVANAIGIGSFDWLGNDKLLFTQIANHDAIFTPIEDLFVINGDGTGLRYIVDGVSSFSLQP